MVRRHRRFALKDVTLSDQPVGGATIDAWEDDDGTERWAARALIRVSQVTEDGVLAGTMRDGRRVSGPVHVAENRAGPRGARVVLVDMYGSGPLLDDEGVRRGG